YDLEVASAHDLLYVDVGLGRDLTGDVGLPGGDQGLHRDPRLRVAGQQRVEDGVADGVRHLVRMALGHRLAGEQSSKCHLAVILRMLGRSLRSVVVSSGPACGPWPQSLRHQLRFHRSEERRVGKEGSSRWSTEQYKKKVTEH